MLDIGSFACYIRRPKPSNSGMTAYFFGDNGSDADLISTLALTQYLNLDMMVSVYLIKDALGLDKKDPETNKYPMIAKFYAKNMRPSPSDAGMTAQFFAANGENADQVNSLGVTSLLDALVFVDLKGLSKSSVENVNIYSNNSDYEERNQREIVENHAWKVAEKEKNDYKIKSKKYLKINTHLHDSDLFLNKKLWDLIDSFDSNYSYKSFILTQNCIFKKNNVLCEHKAENFIQLDERNPYSLLPICLEHLEHVINAEYNCIDYDKFDGKQHYLEFKNIMLIKQWVWNFFIKEFSLTGNEEPSSMKIYNWLSQNNLEDLIPSKFVNALHTLSKIKE